MPRDGRESPELARTGVVWLRGHGMLCCKIVRVGMGETNHRNSSLGWLPRMAAKSRVEAMQNEVKGR